MFPGNKIPSNRISQVSRNTNALLKKGYSEADVQKILGGNLLRVMEAVERASNQMIR